MKCTTTVHNYKHSSSYVLVRKKLALLIFIIIITIYYYYYYYYLALGGYCAPYRPPSLCYFPKSAGGR